MYLFLSIIFGTIPLLQFLVQGYLFFGMSLLLLIISYFVIRRKGSINFMVESTVLLGTQVILVAFDISNIFLFIYIALASSLLYLASMEDRKIDELKSFIKENGFDPDNYDFIFCFFGLGQVKNLEELKNMKSSVLGYGKDGIAFSVKMETGDINRFIKYEELDDYGMFRLEKEQDPHYQKMWELFWPSSRLRTLHKPQLETFGLFFVVKDEIFTFYEEPGLLYKVSNYLDDTV